MTDIVEGIAVAAPASPRTEKKHRARSFNAPTPLGLVVRYILLLVVTVITVGPLLWELGTSLKSKVEDVYAETPTFIPQHFTLANYAEVARTIPVWSFAGNSLIVAAFGVVGNLVGATIAGYALARLRFRGAKLVLGLFLATLVLPGEVTIISQFQTVAKLGFSDTLFGVALPGMIGALNVLLMRQAFLAIPHEIEEAGVLDGANVWQRMRYIGLPSVRGMLSVIAILTFIGAWDDFLWPLIVLQTPSKLTLTVGLAYLQGTFTNDPRTIAAGAMIALIPIVILFAALQKYFFKGVGEGGIKG